MQSAAIPTAVACQRNRLVVPMSGSFNASSRRMLMVRFVLDLDMWTSIVTSAGSCNQLRDFVSFASFRLDALGFRPIPAADRSGSRVVLTTLGRWS